jgi:hypothetical protein
MNQLRNFGILVALSFLTACASQVVEPDAATSTRPLVKALRSFSVELSPKAKEQLADDVKFDVNAVYKKLEITLARAQLIADDGDYRLKVVVTDVRVRGTFSAVMWGFMAGDDHLNGDSILFRQEGEDPVYQFKVKTSYALGGWAGGQDAMRMDWLYEEFSKKIADKLVALRDAKK